MKFNLKKIVIRGILGILMLGIVGVYMLHRESKKYGFSGIKELISVYRENSSLADQVEPKKMFIEVADKDFEFIKSQREKALDRGIQINIGDNYVPCSVEVDGKIVQGEMRLKGHMTDHLEGDKWSFRVKTNDEVLSMYRFSLQEPGTRGYCYEWVYHELLKREGVIHLYYDFIELYLNGESKGIYAIEEHFGQHVLERNNRPGGAILRWNPGLYWDRRINELHGDYLDEDYSKFENTYTEVYDRGVVKNDSDLLSTYENGMILLEDFRRGKKSASEVFDVDKMASFHAIIDLVGGHHSLDWSDVKFYFNFSTSKIEPVGYESFSVRKSESIAGQRITDDYSDPALDYHTQLFADPIFYRAYIKALERICTEEYFNEFISDVQSELDLKRGIVAKEFPLIKFSFDGYFENIELIRNNLDLPKPFHAFIQGQTDTTLQLSLSPVSDFPIEILRVKIDGQWYENRKELVLPPKARRTFSKYFILNIDHQENKVKSVFVEARIPGSSHKFEVEVTEFKYYSDESEEVDTTGQSDWIISLNDSVVAFKDKNVNLSRKILIADGQELIVLPGQSLNFQKDAGIVSYGKISFLGTSENPILVQSSTEEYGMKLLGGELILNAVSIISAEASIFYVEESQVLLNQCQFDDIHALLFEGLKCDVRINEMSSYNSGLGHFDQSLISIRNSRIAGGSEFIAMDGCYGRIRNSDFKNIDTAMSLTGGTYCEVWSTGFKDNYLIASLNENSHFNSYGGQFLSGEYGVSLDEKSRQQGSSSYSFYKPKIDRLKNHIKK